MEVGSTPHSRTFVISALESPILLLGLRILVGLVFVAASIEKIADPAAFGASIANYRVLPASLVLLAATFIPWMELLCGLCLFFGLMVRGSCLLVATMLLIFTAAVFSTLARGLDISCGCFSQDPNARMIGWWKIAENLGLIVADLLVLRGGEGPLSLMGYLRKRYY